MKIVLSILLLISVFASSVALAAPKKAPAKPCVEKLNVIKGCNACETMLSWLQQGGIKVDLTKVERGAYALYPTVEYSDGSKDHGERMYRQEVTIPKSLCVISCESGTN